LSDALHIRQLNHLIICMPELLFWFQDYYNQMLYHLISKTEVIRFLAFIIFASQSTGKLVGAFSLIKVLRRKDFLTVNHALCIY